MASKYFKKFNEHDAYEEFLAGEITFPNVSICDSEAHVHYSNASDVNYILIDQNDTDPSTRISGDVRGTVIQQIRSNSHIYLGRYDSETSKLLITQISDSNKTEFTDGSSATGYLGNLFMKLPEFWWNCGETETDSDIWRCGFSMSKVDGWNHWDGKYFIGVHEAKASQQNATNNADSTNNALNDYTATLSDVPGYTGYSSGNIPQDVFRQMARNLGEGFTITTWNVHCIMALLFYAYYGTTNSQGQCGTGSIYSDRKMGQCDSLGMTDTTTSNSSVSTNFWGLENWWGEKYELIDNVYVTIDGSQAIVNIYNDDESLNRSVATISKASCYNFAILGKAFDLLPASRGGSSTTGYCNSMYVSGANTTYAITDNEGAVHNTSHPGRVGARSNSNADGGVAYCYLNAGPGGASAGYGARLQYHGEYEVAEPVAPYYYED